MSIAISSFVMPPRSYSSLTTQRSPLPHISASLPSLLSTRIRASSPVVDGSTASTPSPPTPNWRSHSAITVSGSWTARPPPRRPSADRRRGSRCRARDTWRSASAEPSTGAARADRFDADQPHASRGPSAGSACSATRWPASMARARASGWARRVALMPAGRAGAGVAAGAAGRRWARARRAPRPVQRALRPAPQGLRRRPRRRWRRRAVTPGAVAPSVAPGSPVPGGRHDRRSRRALGARGRRQALERLGLRGLLLGGELLLRLAELLERVGRVVAGDEREDHRRRS